MGEIIFWIETQVGFDLFSKKFKFFLLILRPIYRLKYGFIEFLSNFKRVFKIFQKTIFFIMNAYFKLNLMEILNILRINSISVHVALVGQGFHTKNPITII